MVLRLEGYGIPANASSNPCASSLFLCDEKERGEDPVLTISKAVATLPKHAKLKLSWGFTKFHIPQELPIGTFSC